LFPVSWLIVRKGADKSEDEENADRAESRNGTSDFNLGEALRSVAFWLFALSSALFGLVYSGISLFNQSILEQRGFDASTYHTRPPGHVL
jgi:hypothetical protein